MTLTPTLVEKIPFDAHSDAEALRAAMKGIGCNDEVLVKILCQRVNSQRQQIAKNFKTSFGRDLLEDVKSETSGDLKKLFIALLTPTLDYYCNELFDACKGIGTDENTLIEILCSLNNRDVEMVKKRFHELYKVELEKVLIGETSGHFRRLLVSLVNANRNESYENDIVQARLDAKALYEAGEKRFGTDESVFNKIMCQRNYAQLRMVFNEYQQLTGHSFEDAIKSEFSGDIKDGLLAIYQCVNDRQAFFARQLYKSMKGLGTNDRQLIRVVVTHCEWDMSQIKESFATLYKDTLKDFIKGDTSGKYQKALLTLIGETA